LFHKRKYWVRACGQEIVDLSTFEKLFSFFSLFGLTARLVSYQNNLKSKKIKKDKKILGFKKWLLCMLDHLNLDSC